MHGERGNPSTDRPKRRWPGRLLLGCLVLPFLVIALLMAAGWLMNWWVDLFALQSGEQYSATVQLDRSSIFECEARWQLSRLRAAFEEAELAPTLDLDEARIEIHDVPARREGAFLGILAAVVPDWKLDSSGNPWRLTLDPALEPALVDRSVAAASNVLAERLQLQGAAHIRVAPAPQGLGLLFQFKQQWMDEPTYAEYQLSDSASSELRTVTGDPVSTLEEAQARYGALPGVEICAEPEASRYWPTATAAIAAGSDFRIAMPVRDELHYQLTLEAGRRVEAHTAQHIGGYMLLVGQGRDCEVQTALPIDAPLGREGTVPEGSAPPEWIRLRAGRLPAYISSVVLEDDPGDAEEPGAPDDPGAPDGE